MTLFALVIETGDWKLFVGVVESDRVAVGVQRGGPG